MDILSTYLNDVARTLSSLASGSLAAVADALWATYEQDSTIFVCGNGGSAATASHFVCDLSKGTSHPEVRRMRAIALTDSVPLISAWSNDQHYADVFIEQLVTLYRPGDLVIAISGSGNSSNVVRAVAWANSVGATTVGLSGFDGGQLMQLVKVSLHVPSASMPQVEDVHSTVCHALIVELRHRMAEANYRTSIPSLLASHGVEAARVVGR